MRLLLFPVVFFLSRRYSGSMIGFYIKKSFFDGWDNLLGLIVQNLLYILVVFGVLGAMSIPEGHTALTLILLVLLVGLFSFLQAGTGNMNYAYSHYEKVGVEGFRKGVASSVRHSLLYWAVLTLLVVILSFVMPFYFSYKTLLGTCIGVLLFWVSLLTFMAIQFYFPLHFTMSGDRPTKTLRKCFIVMVDNLGASFFNLFYVLVQAAISVFTLCLVPGFAGIQLADFDCIKLLMLKYDYLEQNAGADRKHLPWYDLLYSDRESVGPRSLKGMIFPWKY